MTLNEGAGGQCCFVWDEQAFANDNIARDINKTDTIQPSTCAGGAYSRHWSGPCQGPCMPMELTLQDVFLQLAQLPSRHALWLQHDQPLHSLGTRRRCE